MGPDLRFLAPGQAKAIGEVGRAADVVLQGRPVVMPPVRSARAVTAEGVDFVDVGDNAGLITAVEFIPVDSAVRRVLDDRSAQMAEDRHLVGKLRDRPPDAGRLVEASLVEQGKVSARVVQYPNPWRFI